MRKKRKLNLVLIIFVIVLVLGLGYAYLTTTLSINGTTDVDANTWNIYWDNVQVTSGSVSADTPTIDTSKTTVTFSVHLSQPGDFYEFTVDAKNDGTIDAMIDTITKTTTIPNYINYIVSYDDDIEIAQNQLLSANDKETYKVRIEYRTDINSSDLPSSSQSLNVAFGVTYIQADESVIPIRIYHVGRPITQIGNAVPSSLYTYTNYQDTIADFGHPFFLKHTVENNIIIRSYVGFVLNDNVYYLQGGVNESSLTTKPVYESNKSILQTAFSSLNCTEYTMNIECTDSSLGYTVSANTYGNVVFEEETEYIYYCQIDGVSGRAYCGID